MDDVQTLGTRRTCNRGDTHEKTACESRCAASCARHLAPLGAGGELSLLFYHLGHIVPIPPAYQCPPSRSAQELAHTLARHPPRVVRKRARRADVARGIRATRRRKCDFSRRLKIAFGGLFRSISVRVFWFFSSFLFVMKVLQVMGEIDLDQDRRVNTSGPKQLSVASTAYFWRLTAHDRRKMRGVGGPNEAEVRRTA